MDTCGVPNGVLNHYESFVGRFLDLQNDQNLSKIEGEPEGGRPRPDPWSAQNPAFEPGQTVATWPNGTYCTP